MVADCEQVFSRACVSESLHRLGLRPAKSSDFEQAKRQIDYPKPRNSPTNVATLDKCCELKTGKARREPEQEKIVFPVARPRNNGKQQTDFKTKRDKENRRKFGGHSHVLETAYAGKTCLDTQSRKTHLYRDGSQALLTLHTLA